MPMLLKPIKFLLKSFGGIAYGIIGTIVVGCIGLPLLILYAKNILNYILQAMQSPTLLWVTIVLALALGLYVSYIHQQVKKVQALKPPNTEKENFTKRFGILWDENYQPHCGTHKNLLQSYRAYGTSDPAITRWGFICPSCKNPIFIVDQNGKYITQEDAIEKLKNL